MKNLLILFFALSSFQLFAQKNYQPDPNAQLRAITESFSAINVSSGVTVYITAAGVEEVRTSVTNIKKAEAIKISVKGSVLNISFDYNEVKKLKANADKIIVYVNYKAINKVSASSGSVVYFTNLLNAPSLGLIVGSGAICKGEIATEDFSLEAGSGAIVDVYGNVARANISMGSGAIFKNYNLIAKDAIVKLNSGAMCAITVNRTLTAKVGSGASLNYKGTAIATNVSKGTGSSVRKITNK